MDRKRAENSQRVPMVFNQDGYSVSSTAQVLIRDHELLKLKLRHLLQYLNSTRTLGVFADFSFAPSGKHSQSGFTIHLSFRDVHHLIYWQSLREPNIAESSAESELYEPHYPNYLIPQRSCEVVACPS